MKMKKSWIIIGILALLAIIVYSGFKRNYNRMVELSEGVDRQWADVENVYQRRADLIPNLVSTVKGYANFEQQTLTNVIEARAKATSVTVKPDNLDANSLKEFQAAQSQLGGALARLMVVVEQYPDLKANQNFLDLQAQLEGTENRITVERRKFNESAQAYNTFIKKFPQNIYASIFNFDNKPYFEADQGAEKAPQVQF